MLPLTTVFGQENINLEEYKRVVHNMQQTICSLNGYVIDSVSTHWTATDPTGFFSFEGDRFIGDVSNGYDIKLKSFIYSDDYFRQNRNITSTYYIDGKRRETLVLSTGPELFDEGLPFIMTDISIIYFEKTIHLFPSDKIVFDRTDFEAFYIVFFKNNTKKTFVVNSITHKLEAN